MQLWQASAEGSAARLEGEIAGRLSHTNPVVPMRGLAGTAAAVCSGAFAVGTALGYKYRPRASTHEHHHEARVRPSLRLCACVPGPGFGFSAPPAPFPPRPLFHLQYINRRVRGAWKAVSTHAAVAVWFFAHSAVGLCLPSPFRPHGLRANFVIDVLLVPTAAARCPLG